LPQASRQLLLNISYFIAKRLISTRGKSFSSFITRLCIISTAISVCAMILGSAIYDGFEQGIVDKFYNCWGNIHVMPADLNEASFTSTDTIYKDEQLVQRIKETPNVKHVAPFAVTNGLLKSKSNYEGVALKGIDETYDIAKINSFMIDGKPLHFSDSSYSKQILLSKLIAKSLKVQTNDSVIAYIVNGNNEIPRARKLQVCGLYQTGLFENDKVFALVDLKLLHILQGDTMGRIFGYEVQTKNTKLNVQTRDELYNKVLQPPLNAYTIEERFKRVFQWLVLVEQNLSTVYIILIVVALINIITCLFILILERTKMIGLLKSFGQANLGIQRIFIWQNLLISFIGIIAGAALALLLGWLQYQFHVVKLNPEIYYVDYVQLKFVPYKILAIICLTTLLFLAVLLLSSFIVKFISPLKAIRFD
jgi:lipoprotein-releasing system permease protein